MPRKRFAVKTNGPNRAGIRLCNKVHIRFFADRFLDLMRATLQNLHDHRGMVLLGLAEQGRELFGIDSVTSAASVVSRK